MRFLFNYFFIVLTGLFGGQIAKGQSHYPGQHTGKFVLQDKLKPAVYSFDLQDVQLSDSRFTENMKREQQWLAAISATSMLHSFRNSAGVYNIRWDGGYLEKKLGGWESIDCDIRGHATGHILSALALMYATTGDAQYKIKADSVIDGMAEVQAALGPGGYLSAFPEALIDRVITGKPVWVPWYTMHKIWAGLLDQYLYCNNQRALQIAAKMGDWAYKKLQPLTQEQRVKMLETEFGGINETFYNLYAITGKNEYKWLGDFFYHNEVLDPLEQGKDELAGKHANTFIPKIVGLVRNYELNGDGAEYNIASFFWNTVINDHTYCTGSNSDQEHFFKADSISKHLTGLTGESCNVYNMLKLTKHLFSKTADEKYAAYYEKALFNHILGQQDPATGMVAYFLPLLPGAFKLYSTPDSSFWCCVGTGFENQAKYGEGIYYHSQNDLLVNLFIPSSVSWKEKGFSIAQETSFPQSDLIVFTVKSAGADKPALKIRYPQWAVNGAVVKINGKKLKISQTPGSYIVLNHSWKEGDKIEVSFPMSLRIVPANDNPAVAAIAYGPIILAAPLGTEGMKSPAPYSDPKVYNDYFTYNYHVPQSVPTTLSINKNNLATDIVKVAANGLEFRTKKEGLLLKPLYDIHRERYTVYWNLK